MAEVVLKVFWAAESETAVENSIQPMEMCQNMDFMGKNRDFGRKIVIFDGKSHFSDKIASSIQILMVDSSSAPQIIFRMTTHMSIICIKRLL